MRSCLLCLIAGAMGWLACERAATPPPETVMPGWDAVQDSTHRVASVTGFAGPEAVRYDPEQDVFFVSNFNGGGNERDANGFISRVSPEGDVLDLRFMVGTDAHPLHAPRGMFITGDTLWAADADGLHGFDRHSGAHLAFVDFTGFAPGFLNDVTAGPDGALYVTDTGARRVYRRAGARVEVVLEDTTLAPNGITWDAASGRMLLAPWGGDQLFRAWQPGTDSLGVAGTGTGGNYDGIEVVAGRVLVASQTDSSLHVLEDGTSRPVIRTPGRPADIGIDTQQMRVAVPYVALNRVDIWQLPREN